MSDSGHTAWNAVDGLGGFWGRLGPGPKTSPKEENGTDATFYLSSINSYYEKDLLIDEYMTSSKLWKAGGLGPVPAPARGIGSCSAKMNRTGKTRTRG